MSTTGAEQGPTGATSPPGRSGRTLPERIAFWAGLVSLAAAAFEGALKALGGAFKELKSLTEKLNLHGPASWVALIALVVLGAWLLRLGTRKRSRLRLPDALTLRPDEPAHLRGRAYDLEKLVHLCRERALVFLVGESGAGKSALVRSGLCRPGALTASMVPVLVDGWGDDWSDGPTRLLAEALRNAPSLSEGDRAKLDLPLGDRLQGLLTAIKRAKTRLCRTPLLIFDQFDDYQVRHRAQFRDPTTGAWKSAAQIAGLNPFWKGIGELVQTGNAHVLIVTRSDSASGLISVQFVAEPASYPLDRPKAAAVVRPLLDDLTKPDPGRGAVVEDPENGWDRLKDQLAHDLEQDDQVLPIQFRSALAGLIGLRRLTVTLYQRSGGVRGLEAKAVETMVAGAARQSGLDRAQIIRILMMMVNVRAQKTIPKTTAELTAVARADFAMVETALVTLETRELVRRVPASDHSEVSWQLDHDYWCGAVIEAEKRFDRWNALLRDAHQAWREARGDLRKRWQTLLTPSQQTTLIWQRLRGRCRYGLNRGFALLSTLRWLPYLAAVIAAVFGLPMLQQAREREREIELHRWAREYGAVARLLDDGTYEVSFIGNEPPKDFSTAVSVDCSGFANLISSINVVDFALVNLPPDIGKLTNLKALDLSGNGLSSLPPQIRELKRLAALDLSNNGLTSVPPGVTKLTSLTALDLRNNRLSGLPPQIGDLKRLTTLDLRGNVLTSLPPQIGDLTNLMRLEASDNRLTSLPSEVGKLSGLTALNLSHNSLTYLPPEIGELKRLTTLDLSNNVLTSLPPEVGKLSGLTTLDYRDNPLKSLPPDLGPIGRGDDEGWKPLFNGKTILEDGWRIYGDKARYAVEDETIVGTTVEGSLNTFLCKGDFRDLELEFEVKCDPRLNSGVQLRSHIYQKDDPDPKNQERAGVVYGPQCEIAGRDSKTAGRLYDEGRRGAWLTEIMPEARDAFKDDDWNHYRIVVQGHRYRSWVNGVLASDLKDDLDERGFIGLQVHGIPKGEGPYQVRWRYIRIRRLKPGESVH